ncbi:hypothetical protein H2198_000645 [Neophaeococcomyces mojaviensis]|uniref:Uncharacterized protein n=1 Tax=Neophaeococcomyces mojaviensis TaxID=3383035 RepID=A0ACC3AK08_9EURO|nr:hypothetical protein H2198_000645 [Knufia sp. JES_112]
MALVFLVDTPESRRKSFREREPETVQAVQNHLKDYNKRRLREAKALKEPAKVPTGWLRYPFNGNAPFTNSSADSSEAAEGNFFEFCAEGPGSRRIRALLQSNDPGCATINAFGGIAINLDNDRYKVLQYMTQAFLPFISFNYRKGFQTQNCEFWDEDGREFMQRALNNELYASILMAVTVSSLIANFGSQDAWAKMRRESLGIISRMLKYHRDITPNFICGLYCLAATFTFTQDYQTAWKYYSLGRKLIQQLGGFNKLSLATRSLMLHRECQTVAGSGHYFPPEVFLEGSDDKEREYRKMMIDVANSTLSTKGGIIPEKICVLSRTSQYMRCGWELLWPEQTNCLRLAEEWYADIPCEDDVLQLAIKLWLGHFYMFCVNRDKKKASADEKMKPVVLKMEEVLTIEFSTLMLWIIGMGVLAGGDFEGQFVTVAGELGVRNWADFQAGTREYLWLEEYEDAKGMPLTRLLEMSKNYKMCTEE